MGLGVECEEEEVVANTAAGYTRATSLTTPREYS